MTHAQAIETVETMLDRDPDLNLYMLAFDKPELEAAALELAGEYDAIHRVFAETV